MDEEKTLSALRDAIMNSLGIYHSDQQLPILSSKISRALPKLGVKNANELYVRLSLKDDKILSALAAEITIGETYFFRNFAQFEALRDRVFPVLSKTLGAGGTLNVWCAGCATGEEPYSVAMWIKERAPQFWPNRVKIAATDINDNFLSIAEKAVYGEWNFRDRSHDFKARYFDKRGDKYHLSNEIKSVVSFEKHNLYSGALPQSVSPGSLSIVLCRNVLIYFTKQTAAPVLTLFSQALGRNGFLIVGHAENYMLGKDWSAEYYPGAFFYRKTPPGTSANPRDTYSGFLFDMSKESRSTAKIPAVRTRASSRSPAKKAEEIKIAPSRTILGAPSVNLPALLESARKAADSGETALAKKLVDEYLGYNGICVDAYFLKAIIAEQAGDFEQEEDALKKALYLDKKFVLGHYLLAVNHERSLEFDAAKRRYSAVLKLLSDVRDEAELPMGEGMQAKKIRELAQWRVSELNELSALKKEK